MRCPSCGNDNPDEFAFCIECGNQVVQAPPAHGGERWDARQPQAPQDGGYGGAPGGFEPLQREYEPRYGGFEEYPEPEPLARPPQLEPELRPRPSGGLVRLVALEGPTGHSEFEISGPITSIGRSRTNDIVLSDTKVSRVHARIVQTDGGYAIEDLNSRNGTRVDDQVVHGSRPLHDGSLIRIGDSVFRFVGTPGGQAGGAPARPPMPTYEPTGVLDGSDARRADAPSPSGTVPVVFAAPWSPITCPKCFGIRTMRPIVYGPASKTAAAQAAAERGEVVLGGMAMGADGANAQCASCGTRVKILPTSPE